MLTLSLISVLLHSAAGRFPGKPVVIKIINGC